MAGINLHPSDHTERFASETALVPTACHSLTAGSSNPPKFGTLIPNRIFVGGIPSNQVFPRPDIPAALFFAGSAMPYGFQNGMAVFSLPGTEYPVLTQAASPYATTMVLPQPGGGTALYMPSQLHSAASVAGTSPYAQLTQQQFTALQQQHHYQQSMGQATAGGMSPTMTAGQLNPAGTVGANSMGGQQQSTAAVMAAAAAAMAAAVQWPQQPQPNPNASHQTRQQTLSSVSAQATGGAQTVVPNSSMTPQQAAAVAAAVAAQQQAWRWSPTMPQSAQSCVSSSHVANASLMSAATTNTTNSTNSAVNAMSTPGMHNQNALQQQQHAHHNQQVSDPALSLMQPMTLMAGAMPTAPLLTAETAALFAAAIQQHQQQQQTNGLNIFGSSTTGVNSGGFDLSSAAVTLAALASVSVGSPNMSSINQLYQNELAVETSMQQVVPVSANMYMAALDASTQPNKRPRYDSDSTRETGSPTATIGPTTYLYSPITGTGHELMFFHQTSSPYATNSTSDYSTDHSAHSSGILESVEPLGYPCDGTPLGRHTQQLGGQLGNALGSHHLDASCLSPYASVTPLLDLQSHNTGSGHQSQLMHQSNLQQTYRQMQQQSSAAILANQQAASGHHMVSIAAAAQPTIAHAKYSPSVLSTVSNNIQTQASVNVCSLPSSAYTNPLLKSNNLSDLASSDLQDSAVISQAQIMSTTCSAVGLNGMNTQNTPVTSLQCSMSASGISTESTCTGSNLH